MTVPPISDNPLRVLGVFANATQRQIEKNKAQLKAFAHVGQQVELPLWLNGLKLLPPLTGVTEETLAQAQAQLSLQKERDRHALFWFEQDKDHAQDEDIAITLLNGNHVDAAREMWEKRSDRAALKNLLLLAVMDDDWKEIATCATLLFKDDTASFRTFMAEMVKLSREANGPLSLDLLPLFTDEARRAEMKQMLVRNHQHFLDEAIERLKRTKSDDIIALEEEIERGMRARSRVDALKKMLGKDSFTYSFYAKETAKALMKAIMHYTSLTFRVEDSKWAAGIVNEIWADIDLSDPETKDFWLAKNRIESRAKISRASDSSTNSGCADTIWELICLYGFTFLLAILFRGGCGGHRRSYTPPRYDYQRYYKPPKPNIQPVIDMPKIYAPGAPIDLGSVDVGGRHISIDSIKQSR